MPNIEWGRGEAPEVRRICIGLKFALDESVNAEDAK